MLKNPFYKEDLFFISSRAASGFMNGFFYQNSYMFGFVGTIATIIFTVLAIRRRRKDKHKYKKFKKPWLNKLENIVFWISFALSILSIILVAVSFASPAIPFLDIHFWTWITQIFEGFCYLLNNPKNWWRLLLIIVPCVFFQKLFINLLTDHSWAYQGTDIASGQYYTMFGMKIPRLFSGNMYLRLVFTIVSLIILYGKKKEDERKNK